MKMEYTIVSTHDLVALMNRVESKIISGWRPQGGVAVCSFPFLHSDGDLDARVQYYQAMIMEPENIIIHKGEKEDAD